MSLSIEEKKIWDNVTELVDKISLKNSLFFYQKEDGKMGVCFSAKCTKKSLKNAIEMIEDSIEFEEWPEE